MVKLKMWYNVDVHVMVRFGLVCYNIAWYGMVWHGMVHGTRYGTVRQTYHQIVSGWQWFCGRRVWGSKCNCWWYFRRNCNTLRWSWIQFSQKIQQLFLLTLKKQTKVSNTSRKFFLTWRPQPLPRIHIANSLGNHSNRFIVYRTCRNIVTFQWR